MEKYLQFSPEPQPPSRATLSWKVLNTRGEWLGRISWHAPWRRYCYQPVGPQTMDAKCLAEIVGFLEEVMRGHKQFVEERKKGREGK